MTSQRIANDGVDVTRDFLITSSDNNSNFTSTGKPLIESDPVTTEQHTVTTEQHAVTTELGMAATETDAVITTETTTGEVQYHFEGDGEPEKAETTTNNKRNVEHFQNNKTSADDANKSKFYTKCKNGNA